MSKGNKLPIVSIITASFNNKSTIEDTFSSVLIQSYPLIEYIIIDGASTDGTIELINNYENKFKEKLNSFKVIIESDDGIADAWNKGLKEATGEIIFFLNSDDWINKNSVKKAVENIDPNNCEISYGVCNRVDNYKNITESFQKQFNKYRVIWNFGFSFTTCFVTRKTYDSIGGFNINYKIAIDSDFLLRCVKKGVQFRKGNHNTFMRLGGVSTKHRLKAHKEYKRALIANGYPKFLVNLSYLLFKRT